MRRPLTALVPLACLAAVMLAGCGPEPTEPVTLVAFDLRQLTADPAAPVPLAEPGWGLHWLSDNWDASPDSARGVWAYGPEATAWLELTGRDATLHLVVSTSPALSQAGQRCEVLLNDHSLGTVTVDSVWADHVLDAPIPDKALRRGENLLTLRCSRWAQEGAPYAVFLRELSISARLTVREREAWQELLAVPDTPVDFLRVPASAAPTAVAGGARPDVLMVVMDATWAAHVSAYGYERETTPNLDALAAEALVMDQCFSVAPFTVIAVPSLMTGKHWREHGVHGKRQALADSFVTLAEVLAGAGYYTVAYSDNPFVSHGTGVSQGFAEFSEIWTDPDFGGPGLTSELLEQRFVARAREGFGPQPVFAYLHLMPPHAPYYPGPDHDLWSDPDYTGDYDGSADQLDRIDAEHVQLSPADRARIIALYDGNLHRADASLGRILNSWRALGRDRELLVVVLSDHGEAFGEHGWYQHLSTVHDEMLHVPLVLWPRAAWADLEPARERLISLTDILPLLVRRLGVAPPARLEWTGRARSLLAGAVPSPATMVLRTNWHAHTFGLRTERYLVTFDGLTGQQLFDLATDPGATVNLRAERPEVYRDLLGRMRSILGEGRPVSAAAHVITEQERKTLKSLGY